MGVENAVVVLTTGTSAQIFSWLKENVVLGRDSTLERGFSTTFDRIWILVD